MNILVTGANGLLGSSVMTELRRRGHHGIAVGRAPQCRSTDAAAYVQADLCDASAVQALFVGVQPDAVIHCAAWTDVDGAELPENREQVFAVNRDSTQNVAEASRDHGCKLLYVTTDYVFDGPYPAPTIRCASYAIRSARRPMSPISRGCSPTWSRPTDTAATTRSTAAAT